MLAAGKSPSQGASGRTGPACLFGFILFCPFSCKNLIGLRKHLDTHSKEPAYRCEFEGCSFSARSLCSIKLHYRKVHEVGGTPGLCHSQLALLWKVGRP